MNIVLVGAGGTGISSLGFFLSDLGYTNIIAIDSNESQITKELKNIGIKLIVGHGNYQVQTDDIVIFSDACPTAPEVLQSREIHASGVKGAQLPYSYFQFLGEISKYFETIAIAGTHGKSTTTALATYTMKHVDKKFALGILGALVPQLGQKNYRANFDNVGIKNDLQQIFSYIFSGKTATRDESLRKKWRFLIEADEFNRHFLYLDVDHAIILNAELDHSDIYADESTYLETYVQFIHKVKQRVFAIEGEVGIAYLTKQCKSKQITLIEKKNINLPHIFGEHNQKNASLILAILEQIVEEEQRSNAGTETREHIAQIMAGFQGLRRRMELLKKYDNGALLYTDYGHHPTEIHAVYHAMKEKYPERKLIAIFQPHQARRVLQFRRQFASTMQQFNEVFIYNIYAARENLEELLANFPLPGGTQVHSIDSLGMLFAQECSGHYITDFNKVITVIEERTKLGVTIDDAVIILFSAGNLDYMVRDYL